MTKEILSKAQYNELPDLQEIYNQATVYARTVGHIDWPFPMPKYILENFYMKKEMYCIRGLVIGIDPDYAEEPVAAIRLSTEPNPQIWQDDIRALYIGKMAVGRDARNLDVATKVIFPAVHEMAEQRDLSEVRLDCLADNERLKAFYRRHFAELGNVIIKNINGEELSLTRFSRPVTS